ncbi:MAG TPA: inositol-3-phosphate synthase [Bdellovibrionota bacterium]|nr:inositol-3-phosphate synthase [Bdellovibrionota bacterium]
MSKDQKETVKFNVAPATGKLGILCPGMGAVASTFFAGVIAARKGVAQPFGSLTQMGRIRIGKRTDANNPLINEYVPLAKLDQIVFGGWDIFPDDMYTAAKKAGVLEDKHLEPIKEEMAAIKPMTAVYSKKYIRNIESTNIKSGTLWEKAQELRQDIQNFKKKNNCERVVIVWCGSTEAYCQPSPVHATMEAFEEGLKANSEDISPSQVYAYAALKESVPYANGAPNLTVDIPAFMSYSKDHGVAISGRDFKTGQTLMKTILAPGFKSRMLGVKGWFSTNILGNRDGAVLDDPASFKTKELSKLGVLESILQPDLYPDLYKELYHKVDIRYYPPRGDNKEGWDNIDIFGWMGYEMQIKVNFLCRDSILAAPLVLDLALFMDLGQRAGFKGIQEWLSFYYKAPMTKEGLYPENDIFIQQMKLKNTLRAMMGDTEITHTGLDYYDHYQ